MRKFILPLLLLSSLMVLNSCGESYPNAPEKKQNTKEENAEAKTVSKTNDMNVYVHFMPWFETDKTNNGKWPFHWTMNTRDPNVVDVTGKRQIASHYYPLTGPYASGDAAILDYQCLLMKYCGVDGVMVDWYGINSDNDIAKHKSNTEALANAIAKAGLKMAIVYEFPRQPHLSDFAIMDEETQFAFPFDAKTWAMPTEGTNYYEALWTADPLSRKPEVSTPITMEVDNDLYLVVHEANLTDYSSLNLKPIAAAKGTTTVKAELVPWSTGELVFAKAPFVSPWRTIIVGHKPADLVASRLMLNLNEPCKIKDTSWLETGKYVGIWWGMHMNDMTWSQGKKHGATTENTRRYIDFAADHGMKGVLVEGWNYGWDNDWGREGDKFSFTKPYPDYDLEGLQRYALSKGVRMIAHNETGGAAANYEQQLDSAFALYERLGIRVVKTGYVNAKLDNKELQHSQYGVRHYRKVIETAAKYHLMIINHEPAMPTGLQRTYPNLVSGEGARGQEYNAWSEDGGNPPYHLCILPFTRVLAGPLDFTPGIFRIEGRVHPQTHPQTTLAKQLATYVTLYAPWQMAADEIENYKGQPAFAFIEQVPTNWQESRVLQAEIGKYIVTARKDRDSENWFVGGMTDADARDLTMRFDFLDKDAKYHAIIYRDGPDATYKGNPYPMVIDQMTIDHTTVLPIHLAPSGGFAISIMKK